VAEIRVSVEVASIDTSKITQKLVAAWANDDNGPVFVELLDPLATRLQLDARRRVGVHTGRLWNTIRKQRRNSPGRPGVAVLAGLARQTPYLGVHMAGAPPHEIRARNRKFLRWTDKAGVVHFARRVWHPGNRANPFLTDALDDLTL
jgi:hypothetical protein